MKEVTYEEWQKNPTPRMMWVWDGNERDRVMRKVIYFIEDRNACYPIITLCKDGTVSVGFKHCAEIIEEPKIRRMTNRELAWWLRDGKHREYINRAGDYVHSEYMYLLYDAEDTVDDNILIREGDGDWHEPLVEVEE